MAALTMDLLTKFVNLASALSPENLFCDGERSKTAARRVERSLKAQWKALEKELGRPVSESEVWATFVELDRARRALDKHP